MAKRAPKQPSRKRNVRVVALAPPCAVPTLSGTAPDARERWDLFNLGVSIYTLPLNLERMFADAREQEIDPVHTDRAPLVIQETFALRESACRLAPTPVAESTFQDAVELLLAGPSFDEPVAWSLAQSQLVTATAAVVGFCCPRLPWFEFGTAIGNWRHQTVTHLDRLLTEAVRATGRRPEPVTRASLLSDYVPAPFAPMFRASAQIDPSDTTNINPVGYLVTAWDANRDETRLRGIVREFAAETDFGKEAWHLDLHSVNGLESAVYHALEADLSAPPRPTWNRRSGTLRYQGRVARTYAVQATSVRAVLDRFERENWPMEVRAPDSVLATLTDTIRSLNNGLTQLRFSAKGDAIAWSAKRK